MFLLGISFLFPFHALSSALDLSDEKKSPYALPIPSSGKANISTGKVLWDQGKEHFEKYYIGQLKPRHTQDELRSLFDLIEETARQGKLYTPVHFKKTGSFDGLTLDFVVKKETIVQFYLMNAFDKALVELLDTANEITQKAIYLKSDLEILKTYFFNICAVLKKIEFMTNNVFGVTNDEFNLQEFTNYFGQVSYTPANNIKLYSQNFVHSILAEKEGKLSIYDYIIHNTQLYYMLFVNQYIFIDSHLKDPKNPNRKLLKRTCVNGKLGDYKFDFQAMPLPKLSELNSLPETLGNDQILLENEPEEPSQKNEATLHPEISVPSALPESTEKKAEIASPIQHSAAETHSKQEAAIASSSTSLPSPVLPAASQRRPTLSSSTPNDLKVTIDKLSQLEDVLKKHDGGASAGMKTRHFLSLAQALNKLGYFSHFEADKKEVKIKIDPTDQNPGVVSVMHTNHTGTSKETGITRPTAAKMQEIVTILREKAQASSSTAEKRE